MHTDRHFEIRRDYLFFELMDVRKNSEYHALNIGRATRVETCKNLVEMATRNKY